MDPFVHLHCRSYFSLKDGAYSPEHLALRAAELGMPAVALTDRDGLYGVARFVTACREVGVNPILGAWLTASSAAPVDGAAPRYRVLLIARDACGYANLCRLITAAHMAGDRGDPHLDQSQILERAEGLVCLLGSESGPGTLAAAGMADAAREATLPWREAFGQAKPYKIGTLQPLSGAAAAGAGPASTCFRKSTPSIASIIGCARGPTAAAAVPKNSEKITICRISFVAIASIMEAGTRWAFLGARLRR